MDLEPNDDQLALVDELRRFLGARVPAPALASPEVWDELAAMGVLTLPVAEADGGVGLGWAEAALAFQELGRAGIAGPFVATAAARALGLAEGVTGLVPDGAGAPAGLTAGVAGSVPDGAPGGLTAGVTGLVPDGAGAPAGLTAGVTGLVPDGAPGGLRAGVAGLVPDGAGAPAVVEHLDRLDALLAVGEGGVRRLPLPLVLAGADPVERPLDPLTPVHVVAELPEGDVVGDALTARLLARHAALLSAAMQVGLGYATLAMATAYAGERQQFGRPIGSFQAVKHLLADAVVGLEVARAAVDAAAVTADEAGAVSKSAAVSGSAAVGGSGGVGGSGSVADAALAVDQAVASARVVASHAATAAARASIQVHGGMGYTWELDAHLYLKRILALDQTPATVESALDQLAHALG